MGERYRFLRFCALLFGALVVTDPWRSSSHSWAVSGLAALLFVPVAALAYLDSRALSDRNQEKRVLPGTFRPIPEREPRPGALRADLQPQGVPDDHSARTDS